MALRGLDLHSHMRLSQVPITASVQRRLAHLLRMEHESSLRISVWRSQRMHFPRSTRRSEHRAAGGRSGDRLLGRRGSEVDHRKRHSPAMTQNGRRKPNQHRLGDAFRLAVSR